MTDAPKFQIFNGVGAGLLQGQLVQREAVGPGSSVRQIFSHVDPSLCTAIGISLVTMFGQSQAKAQSWSQPATTNANNTLAYRSNPTRVDLVVSVRSKEQFDLIKLLIPRARPMVLNGETFALLETYQDVQVARTKATQLEGSVPWKMELLIYNRQIPSGQQGYNEVNPNLARGFKPAAPVFPAAKPYETAANTQPKPSLRPAPVSPKSSTNTLASSSTQPSTNLQATPKPGAPSATLVASAAAATATETPTATAAPAATTTPTESATLQAPIGNETTALASNSTGTTSQPTTYSAAASSYQTVLQNPSNRFGSSSKNQPITAPKTLARSQPITAPSQVASKPTLKPSQKLANTKAITAPQQLASKPTITPPDQPSSKQAVQPSSQAGSVGTAENPAAVAIRAPISSESIRALAVNPDLDYIFVTVTSDSDLTKLASLGHDVTSSPVRLSGGARVVQVGTFFRSRIGRQLKDDTLSALKDAGFVPTVLAARAS